MPGPIPLISNQALNNATLPFGLALACKGFAVVLGNLRLRPGLNVYRDRLTYKAPWLRASVFPSHRLNRVAWSQRSLLETFPPCLGGHSLAWPPFLRASSLGFLQAEIKEARKGALAGAKAMRDANCASPHTLRGKGDSPRRRTHSQLLGLYEDVD